MTDIGVIWIDDIPPEWDGKTHIVHAVQMSREELAVLLPLEIGRVDRFRFIESPVVPPLEEQMKGIRHIDSNSKLGRRLNSKKPKWGGRSYRGQPTGGKELERGARSYMVTHYPPLYNERLGQWQEPVPRPGHGIVNTMSKKDFDLRVTYAHGE